jgi:hypothetical protein
MNYPSSSQTFNNYFFIGEALTNLTERAVAWQQKAEKLLKTDELVVELKKLSDFSIGQGKKSSQEHYSENSENSDADTESENEAEKNSSKLVKKASKDLPEVLLSPKTQNLLEELLLEGKCLQFDTNLFYRF